jgi:hypothetical protein
MRKTLIASSVAALTLAGLAGGGAYATESGAFPTIPTSEVPGVDIFADLGLTSEQIDCLVSSIGSTDISDTAALMELFTQCGISIDELLQTGGTTESSIEPVVTETTALEAPPPAELDPEAVTAVFALFDLDQSAVDCLVGEAEAVAPTDDATAEGVFVTCGVGPLQLLEAIVALDALAGAIAAPVDTSTVTLEPPPTLDVAGTETTAVSSGNAMVDLLLEQLAAQGINLDAEQGQCLLDNISDFDPNDIDSVLAVMETCGIDLTDLLTGG